MPGDPKKCREEALRCAGLAEAASAPDARQRYFDLAAAWITLASQLESDQGFLTRCAPSKLTPTSPCRCGELGEKNSSR